MSTTNLDILQQAAANHRSGDLAGAEMLYQAVLRQHPQNFDALHLLGVIRLQQARHNESLELFRAALRQQPHAAQPHYHLGLALTALSRSGEAVDVLDQAIQLDPRLAPAWATHGKALAALERHAEAIASYDKALSLVPGNAEALNMRGSSLAALGRFPEAIASWQGALQFVPGNAATLSNIQIALTKLHDDALALADSFRGEEAVALLDAAIALAPDVAQLHFSRAAFLQTLGKTEESIAAYQDALALEPDDASTLAQLMFQRRAICDWNGLDGDRGTLTAQIERGQSIRPLACVALLDDPALHMRNARQFIDMVLAEKHLSEKPAPLWRGERYQNPKIRLAYLSGDYRDHPVAQLIAELLEAHDRAAFEIVGLSYGPNDRNPLRQRLERACDSFHDVAHLSDEEIARWLRDHRIDIAVDLSGHTEHGRLTVFAYRGAPVQVNYLGFSGTMGADFVDYVLLDSTVVPPADRRHFFEKVVYLPHSFMAPYTARSISRETPTRTQLGLPPSGFIYCCFNNTYKIAPEIFDSWMNVLRSVDGSVLWITCSNTTAKTNLRKRAVLRGVDPSRLVFAGHIPHTPDYLARYRRADLFLDTLPYNAHTTASDALWVGIPVLTCTGSTFAGRVAASLLQAAGLPDLVTSSLPDYEALATRLANEPDLMQALRDRLDPSCRTAPLFDTPCFRRNIESAYKAMLQIAYEEKEPRAFSVSDVRP